MSAAFDAMFAAGPVRKKRSNLIDEILSAADPDRAERARLALLDTAWTDRALAELLGALGEREALSPSTVYAWRARNGVQR